MRAGLVISSALTAIGAVCASASAQEFASAKVDSKPLCALHGDGCDAPPAQWAWQRFEPRVGGFSVEIPCNGKQADAFGQLLAMSRAKFPASNTRSCMKAAAGFSATLVGFSALPDDATPPDDLLRGAPDMFTAFVQQGVNKGIPETTFKGRRAIANTIEKADRRSKVVVVEAGRYGIILLTADILEGFPGTREEADTAADRFLSSLEFVE